MKKNIIVFEVVFIILFICFSNVNAYISGVTNDFINYNIYNPVTKNIDTIMSSINFTVENNLYLPQKEGYHFDGWYYDKEYKYQVKKNTVKSLDIKKLKQNNYMLYGKWEENTSNFFNKYIYLLMIILLCITNGILIIIFIKKLRSIKRKFN